MSVALVSGGNNITLPNPAHNQPVETFGNQSVNYTQGNVAVIYRHGTARYRITRTFEGLSNSEAAALSAFYEAIGRSSGTLTYVGTSCRIIEEPRFTKVMKNIWDATLVFEQSTFPG